MFVQLARDSFVRRFEDFGFIMNQATREDRIYDRTGAVFLEHLPRDPEPIETLVDALTGIYTDVTRHVLVEDLTSFIQDLERDRFVVTGPDAATTVRNQPTFSYRDSPLVLQKTPASLGIASSGPFLERHFAQHPRLYSMQIEVTSRCNEKCLHCYLPAGRGREDVSKGLILDVLDQLTEMGTLDVTFTGGEPMLNPDLPLLLERARRNDFSLGLLTNGTLLSDDLVAVLREVNVALIQISLYSMVPETHDRITGVPGSWTRTRAAIARLVAENIRVQINCPVMKENLATFAEVLVFGEELGVKVNPDVILMARTNFSTHNLAHRLTIDEVEVAIEAIIHYDNNYRAALLDPDPIRKSLDPDLPICGVGTYMMCLAADGEYYPCPGFKFVLGNTRNDSVQHVWTQSERIRTLRQMKTASYPQCLTCDAWDYCCICLAKNYNESGGDLLQIPEHFCRVSHLNKTLAEKWKVSCRHKLTDET